MLETVLQKVCFIVKALAPATSHEGGNNAGANDELTPDGMEFDNIIISSK